MSLRFSSLSKRFEDALIFANQLHARQKRKGTSVPYISHLLGVASLVLEDGGNEDQAIAALLHDAVEDQGGEETLLLIRQRFGYKVANIVRGCTDSMVPPKPPWKERKSKYLARLGGEPVETQRVSLADKVHNARSILTDLRREGEKTWKRFNGGKRGTLWYYRELVRIFRECNHSPLVLELEWVVGEIERLSDKFDINE